MTQHTDLIERLRDPLKNAFMPTRREAAAALEAQAREIEGLRKDAALVAARVKERCAQLCESEWSNIAEKMYGAQLAAAIRALNTEGEGNVPTT